MLRRRGLYQCTTCGGILRAGERRAHLAQDHDGAAALTSTQVTAALPGTIDIMHPGRAAKWGYTDAEICVVIPGLQATSAGRRAEQESSDG